MERDEVLKILLEFFFDSFSEDAAGVGDWFAQGGNDIDVFFNSALDIAEQLKKKG